MTGRHITFDVFGTLLLYGDMAAELAEWTGALHEALVRSGLTCDLAAFTEKCGSLFRFETEPTPYPGLTIFERRLRDVAASFGLDLPPDAVRDLPDGLLAIWNRYFTLDTDAPLVLEELARRATLHVVSNFDHPSNVRRILREYGLEQYFTTIIISGEAGVRKPDPRIFCPVVTGAGTGPGAIVHVGDSADDVEGARAAGLVPVLVRRSPVSGHDLPITPRPSADRDVTVIASLPELLPLLEEPL